MKHDFLDKYADLNSLIHRRDARAKWLAALPAIIILVTTPTGATKAFAGYAAIMALAILLSRVPVGYILKRAAVIVPFAAMAVIFVPFFRIEPFEQPISLGPIHISQSGLAFSVTTIIKAFLAVITLILLSATTPFAKLLAGLAKLKIPTVFLTLTGMAYRFQFVLVDEIYRMRRARDCRGYRGRWLGDAKIIGQMIATLFLRSTERAQRVYQAMLSRGYDGKIPLSDPDRFTAADTLFVTVTILLFLTSRFLLNAH